MSLLPDNLPEAWREGVTTALALSLALSKKQGKPLPWPVVSKAIQGALSARYLERTVDSGDWPCDYAGAQTVKLRVPQVATPLPPPPPPPPPGRMVAEADLEPSQIQDLAEQMPTITQSAVGLGLKIHVHIEVGEKAPPPAEAVRKINEVLMEVSDGFSLV